MTLAETRNSARHIDELENRERQSVIFRSKWHTWERFKLIIALGVTAACAAIGLLWYVSY